MAGTLNVDTIQNSAGTKPPAVTRGEFVQARALYNGSTNTVADSFGVSSLTDNGTGDHSINFSTAFPNASYSPMAQSTLLTSVSLSGTASLMRINTINTSFTPSDSSFVSGTAVGDYA